MLHRLLIFTFLWFLSAILPVADSSAQEQEHGDDTSRGVTTLHAPEDEASAESGPSRTYANRHALVVGINEYEDPGYPDLGYAVADAQAMARIMAERFQFPEQNIKLLLNGDATRDAIAEALEEWACDPDRVGEEDMFLVFFAGHGVTRTLGSRGDRGYLVPVDGKKDRKARPSWGTLIGMHDFEEVSEAIPAKHALFILDCCFGGLAVKRSDPPVAAGLTSRARQVITAGGADQEVLDTGGGGHSVFTGSLLSALRGDADVDGNSTVTFGEIFNHVGLEVQRKTESTQTPLQATFPDHGGGCVAFFPPGVEPGGMTAAERLTALQRSESEKLAELERLSDYILVQALQREEKELWPRIPEMVPRYRQWLVRARELFERKHEHEASVRQVRQEAHLGQVVSGSLAEGGAEELDWSAVDPKLAWRYETFTELVRRLGELDQIATDIRRRLEVARTVRQRTIDEAADAWNDAIQDIAASREYAGLRITPQLGLLPIGPDPETGLWEFAHFASGEIPERNPATGKLELREESGMVFVLLPGGACLVGSQRDDTDLPNFDPFSMRLEWPVQEAKLSPFFLSKYEVSQAQWKRFARENPSFYGPEGAARYPDRRGRAPTLLHPVEQVDWWGCLEWTKRQGLTLPTEAQWEYAARGGTDIIAWVGPWKASLQNSVNFADGPGSSETDGVTEEPLNDAYPGPAPVHAMPANPFGLHHILGNVFEWCLDGAGVGAYSTRRDPFRPYEGNTHRTIRGGSAYDPAIHARSAARSMHPPTYQSRSVGLRPARSLTP